jgi:hypothetical protein
MEKLSSIDVVSELFLPETSPVYPGKVWFDWPRFMDLMVKHKVPATRVFGVYVPWLDTHEQRAAVQPWPYNPKTKKYDLAYYREDWVERVTERLNALTDAGIKVIISIEEHCSRTGEKEFARHPLSAHNNVQGFGPTDVRQSTWTGPDHQNPDLWLTENYRLFEFYRSCVKPKNRGLLRWELCNEPVNPDVPWRVLKFLQSRGIKRDQIWSSVTPPRRKSSFFEPKGFGDDSKNDFKRGCSVVSVHSCGAWDEAQIYISGKQSSLYRNYNKYCEGDYQDYAEKLNPPVYVRPDNDGSYTPDGQMLWKVHKNHVMVPNGGTRSVAKIIEKYGSAAFLLLENDYALTTDEWKLTWKTAEPFFRVIGGV